MIRHLELQPAQAEALRELSEQADLAKQRLTLAFSIVVRGFGIIEASMPNLIGNTLSVTVPGDPPVDPEDGA